MAVVPTSRGNRRAIICVCLAYGISSFASLTLTVLCDNRDGVGWLIRLELVRPLRLQDTPRQARSRLIGRQMTHVDPEKPTAVLAGRIKLAQFTVSCLPRG